MQNINYSFIIPHHNSPELLIRCLDSIPRRSDIEIIVVDDNSDLDKRPIISRNDVILIQIEKEESMGAGRARNYGLRVASGKWLLFSDCDDFYAIHFLDVLDKFIMTDIEILYFDVFYAYDIDKNIEIWPNFYSKAIKNYQVDPRDKNLTVVKHIIQSPWNFMVRREIPLGRFIEFEEIPRGNDAYFHHMVSMSCHKVGISDKKLYYWLWRNDSITHKKLNKHEYLVSVHSQNLHFKKITDLRIKACAWSTIPSFCCGFVSIVKEYGLFCAFKSKFDLLFCGVPWLKVWFHKLLY